MFSRGENFGAYRAITYLQEGGYIDISISLITVYNRVYVSPFPLYTHMQKFNSGSHTCSSSAPSLIYSLDYLLISYCAYFISLTLL